MKLCLSMIVKNESARIERALASCAQFIDSWVIVDTGSTDDTKEKIVNFFEAHGIKGEIRDAPFENWSQARNAALDWARKLSFAYEPDYFLLMDADMELCVFDRDQFLADRDGASYDMYQKAGALHYQNRRLVNAKVKGSYVGATHEYLDVDTAGCIPEHVALFIDHADGSNRPEKYRRDIALLKKDLKTDPTNVRSFFYLAQSYRDSGQWEKAAKWYKRRVTAGGWDEEVWQAQVYYAHCLGNMGNEAGFVRELHVAYNMRPQRAESMYDLAHHYRMKGMNAIALACAEAVEHLPFSTDALFVNDYVYKVGIKEEISITGFYVPGKRKKAFQVTDALTLQAGPYGGARELARNNLYHYLQPLDELIHSFEWKRVPFTPPDGWTAMNPSVALDGDRIKCNVRCVNYRIDEGGRYIIRGTDGTANATNPINTRNFILDLGADAWSETHDMMAPVAYELLAPKDLPCEFPLVVGFEDVRLIPRHDGLWTSATVRQLHADGNCEQVYSRAAEIGQGLQGKTIHYELRDMKRMLRLPRETEKNWAPIIGHPHEQQRFMWKVGEVCDTTGATLVKHDTGLASDQIRGSSQVIKWPHGWLAVTHEARQLPGSAKRYYYHRFVNYNQDFSARRISRPFVFNDRVIEFCAGMCWAGDNKHVLISYGFRDEEARLARIAASDIEEFLWRP